jgi:hypothetical protein
MNYLSMTSITAKEVANICFCQKMDLYLVSGGGCHYIIGQSKKKSGYQLFTRQSNVFKRSLLQLTKTLSKGVVYLQNLQGKCIRKEHLERLKKASKRIRQKMFKKA